MGALWVLGAVAVWGQTITIIHVSNTSFCQGAPIDIVFESTGTYTSDNIYSLQLSNTSGSFTTTLWSTQSNGNGPFNIHLDHITGVPGGNDYSIRIFSSDPGNVPNPFGLITIFEALVAQPSDIQIEDVLCFGESTGSINLTPSGGTPPFDYSIDLGTTWQSTSTFNNLSAGNYTITVRDIHNCELEIIDVPVEEPAAALAASITAQTSVLCFGNSTGSATVTATNGTPGYTYSWAPSGGTAATATGLTAGTYTVTVTDAAGCTTTATATITQPSAALAASISCFPHLFATPM